MSLSSPLPLPQTAPLRRTHSHTLMGSCYRPASSVEAQTSSVCSQTSPTSTRFPRRLRLPLRLPLLPVIVLVLIASLGQAATDSGGIDTTFRRVVDKVTKTPRHSDTELLRHGSRMRHVNSTHTPPPTSQIALRYLLPICVFVVRVDRRNRMRDNRSVVLELHV